MILQSQVSREYQGTKYEKFWVVVPSEAIIKLNWKKGQELKIEIKDKKLIMEKEDWKN